MRIANIYTRAIELAKKFIPFFLYDGSSSASSAQLFFTSFKTVLLDRIVTAVISAHIKKKLSTLGEFSCSHLNVEDGIKHATFLVYYALLFPEK